MFSLELGEDLKTNKMKTATTKKDIPIKDKRKFLSNLFQHVEHWDTKTVKDRYNYYFKRQILN